MDIKMDTLVVISDIHANLEALRAVKRDLARRGLSNAPLCFLGDAVNMGPWPSETVKTLRAMAPLCRVRGNHDRYAAEPQNREFLESYFRGPEGADHAEWTRSRLDEEDRTWLAAAPSETTFAIRGAAFLCFHASPGNDEAVFKPDQAGSGIRIACGHIHAPYIHPLPGGGMIVNPGSVGSPLDGDTRASYAVLRTAPSLSAEIIRVEYDAEPVISGLLGVPWGQAIGRVLRKASLH